MFVVGRDAGHEAPLSWNEKFGTVHMPQRSGGLPHESHRPSASTGTIRKSHRNGSAGGQTPLTPVDGRQNGPEDSW
jgi:hypothetical protein